MNSFTRIQEKRLHVFFVRFRGFHVGRLHLHLSSDILLFIRKPAYGTHFVFRLVFFAGFVRGVFVGVLGYVFCDLLRFSLAGVHLFAEFILVEGFLGSRVS